MRDFLTIGLEHLSDGRAELGPELLRKNYVQTIFKIGFDQVAKLRDYADELARIPGFQIAMLDTDDREFVEALRRFKPLIYSPAGFRNFESTADVEKARTRLNALHAMVETFVGSFGAIQHPLSRTFNTATIYFALHGTFQPNPINAGDLETWLAHGFKLPDIDVPEPIRPFATQWWSELREELEPLVGKKIDPRFIASLVIKL